MNISNFTLTKETKEKMNKPLSNKQKGALRSQKLKELAESGKLAMIKNRGDLAEAVGYPYAQRNTSGYQWIHYKIERGELIERITGYTDDGHAEYEYQYVEPKAKPAEPVSPVVKVSEPARTVNEMLEDAFKGSNMTITITKGDLTIRIEHADKGVVEDIIKSIKE